MPTFTTLAMETQTPIVTPLPTRTSTPSPTLSPSEVQAYILDLLQKNAGCRLPCWWGIVPGQTAWQEAESFLAPLSSEIGEFSLGEQVRYTVYIEVPEEVYPTVRPHHYTVQNGLIQMIEMLLGNVPTYGLSTLILRKNSRFLIG